MENKDLDQVDKEIIFHLFQDGTLPYSKIGEKLKWIRKKSFSHTAISKRIQRLKDNKTMKIQAVVNPNHMRLHSAYFLIETKDYEAQRRILEKTRLCPRVIYVDLLSAQYNIIMKISTQERNEIDCFLSRMIKSDENIRSYVKYESNSHVKPKFFPLELTSDHRSDEKRTPCGTNCLYCGMYKDEACPGCPATIYSHKKYADFQ